MSEINYESLFDFLKTWSSDGDKVDLSFFSEDSCFYVSVNYRHEYDSFDPLQANDVVLLINRLHEFGLHLVSVCTSKSYVSVKCWL